MQATYINNFVRESNKIEGITRSPSDSELTEFSTFMARDVITVEDMERFVKIYEPTAQLRRKVGQNVRIGGYYPPSGGPKIEEELTNLLLDITAGLGPWEAHKRYEDLHPFTDGNGRSGRMLWAWQMGPFQLQLGFLHTFYYQTLAR